MRIPFGDLVINETARRYIEKALDKNWITEGDNVAEFEEKFAKMFGWKHCITTSSGTTAGEVVWAAVRELARIDHDCLAGDSDYNRSDVIPRVVTPACAFVSTANCILAAGMKPEFIDIERTTLNLSARKLDTHFGDVVQDWIVGIQFVATMGSARPINEIAKIAEDCDLYLVGDFCEAHNARLFKGPDEPYDCADHFADAAIYSFYTAHLIVAGEGGCICTNDDEIAKLCRSIKTHGRELGDNFFLFNRPGFNAKWSDLHAAVGLASLEKFWENFRLRREVRRKLIQALSEFEDRIILFRDQENEIIAPHAFPVLLRDAPDNKQHDLLLHLRLAGIEAKTLFWSLPTQHEAYRSMGHELGEFPVAESVGRFGLHFGCGEFISDTDVAYIQDKFREFFRK